MPKLRVAKSNGTLGAKSRAEKIVQKQAHVEVYLPFMVSQGNDGRDLLHPDFMEMIRKSVLEVLPDARFTPTGGYYLVDGKVCRVEDFDPETMDRKPGTFPPSWASAGDEKKEALLAERNAEQAKLANKLGHQPERLLTSKETDEVRKSASKKVLRPVPKTTRPKVSVKMRKSK